jgi:hypothetical protein
MESVTLLDCHGDGAIAPGAVTFYYDEERVLAGRHLAADGDAAVETAVAIRGAAGHAGDALRSIVGFTLSCIVASVIERGPPG